MMQMMKGTWTGLAAAACAGLQSFAHAAIATANVSVEPQGVGAAFVAADRHTGRVWKPAIAINKVRLANFHFDYAPDPERTDEFTVTMRSPGPAEAEPMTNKVFYPAPLVTRPGDRMVLPIQEGLSMPVDEDMPRIHDPSAHGNGLSMPFVGIETPDGSGWMAIIETPNDASVATMRLKPERLWSIGPMWLPSKGKLAYPRRVRYVFFGPGENLHVRMAKRYREHAKAQGLLVTLAEKAKKNPNVERIVGAVNVWCRAPKKLHLAQALKEAGIDRFLWSMMSTPEETRAIAALPNVLIGRYDCYQDVFTPEQIAKLKRKKTPEHAEAWPEDIAWNSADSNDWRRAWSVQAPDGEWTHCAMMCDLRAPEHARRTIEKDLKTYPYTARFIDTTATVAWYECFNPVHPMTRSESRAARFDLLKTVRDFGLVVGSEVGCDAFVPVCDYFEGMMGIEAYRVPGAGRTPFDIWTNAPPENMVKYNLGEKYRIPLWELVYHDCVCAHWYWGDFSNKIPSLWDRRDLFNVLYGTMPMFAIRDDWWAQWKDRFVQSYRLTSPVARATGHSEMVSHRFLAADRRVQQTEFADGTIVTVDFAKGTSKVEKRK